jgi:SAM-dependent methyltransferase
MGRSLDTQAIGLDVGLGFVKWLTGAENLHYGLWDGLDVSAANLGTAQAAYTTKLFGLLPEGRLRILDVGGGAGETARKLVALGHEVDIVVPSPLLARHCRANAPEARVHLARFEDAAFAGPFDLCLFSESFQYIPLDVSLSRARDLVGPAGHILIADCFRAPGFKGGGKVRTVGGGHPLNRFRRTLDDLRLETLHDEDITASVAPSIDLEAGLFRVFGHAVTRIDEELAASRPTARWALDRLLRTLVSERRRHRIMERLRGEGRTSEAFLASNRYLMVKLRKPA